MSEQGFTLTRKGAIAILTFDQPAKLNALSKRQMIAFGQACRAIGEDSGVRCLVVTGVGRSFCTGADASDQETPPDCASGPPVRLNDTRIDFMTPLVLCPKPTIAAVNGVAVGAGLGIALACDIRIAAKGGALLANFCDLGILAADGAPYLLSRLVGVSRALEIMYLCDRIKAPEAHAMGLVNHVAPDERVLEEALALAERIAAKAPAAIRMIKAAVLNGHTMPWRDALAEQEVAYASSAMPSF